MGHRLRVSVQHNLPRRRGGFSLTVLEQAVIDCLMTHVLTRDNLQPIASELAGILNDRNRDVDVRVAALEDELESVQKLLNNLINPFERMGYAADLQRRYDQRKGEEARLLTELSILKSIHVAPTKIGDIIDAALDEWVQHIRTALKDGDRGVARRALRQFVEKIVVKNGTGTLYYTFPLETELYMT